MNIKDLTAEDLDDIVHDVASEIATEEMNKTSNESEQEDILKGHELNASKTNNKGIEAQLEFIKAYGLTDEDILKRI